MVAIHNADHAIKIITNAAGNATHNIICRECFAVISMKSLKCGFFIHSTLDLNVLSTAKSHFQSGSQLFRILYKDYVGLVTVSFAVDWSRCS